MLTKRTSKITTFISLLALTIIFTPQLTHAGSGGGSGSSGGGGGSIGEDAVGQATLGAFLFRKHVRACGSGNFAPRKIRCIARELDSLADDIHTSNVQQVSPKLVPVIHRAASRLRQLSSQARSTTRKVRQVRKVRVTRRVKVTRKVRVKRRVRVKTKTGKMKWVRKFKTVRKTRTVRRHKTVRKVVTKTVRRTSRPAKRRVLSVLRRAKSIIRALAVRRTGSAKRVSATVSSAFSAAINVVARKI